MFKINTNFIPSDAKIFIVGGTVRDILMELPPKDYDIVTFSDPETLADEIAANTRGKIIELGRPGAKIFRIINPEQTYDIAPANGRSIEEDLAKRDFTINAMAISTDSGKIFDPHNGMEDLKSRVVRMICADNLRNDPIRLLRAYRIGALLNFSIDPETSRAIRSTAALIDQSAGERIKDELITLLGSSKSHPYIVMMDQTGLLTTIFPELSPLKGCSQNIYHQFNAFEHTLSAYDFLEKLLHSPDIFAPEISNLNKILPDEKNFALLKYAILIHDIGKPATRSVDSKGNIHFYTHEKKSADMAVNINRRLRLSNAEQRYVDFIIRHHLKALPLYTAFKHDRLTKKAAARFFLKCGHMAKEILIHTAADLYGKGIKENTREFIEFLNHMIQIYSDSFLHIESIPPPLINGNDLIREFSLKPSPLFSKILTYIEEERFSENISTRDEALAHVKKFLNLE